MEGTLFGNGERTGNIDILNIAYNMFSQGIDPELNIENIKEIIEVYERCCKMDIDMRHPYAGKLVFTAFSGSHQDAINKGVHALNERNTGIWGSTVSSDRSGRHRQRVRAGGSYQQPVRKRRRSVCYGIHVWLQASERDAQGVR